MRRSILVLKTGEALASVKARRGDFEEWIAEGLLRGLQEVEVAAVYEGEALPPVDSHAGVVVTGSPGMVSDREAWSEASGHWLARIVAQDRMPVLGLCYGHQLIAHGLGGEVGPNPNGREMGTVETRFEAAGRGQRVAGLAPLFEPGAMLAHMSHVESVLHPPAGAQVLASTDLEPHAALQFGPRQWGVQFHPEFDREIMQLYVEVRRESLVAEGLDPDSMITQARETPESAGVLARFAEIVDRS
jgi:GMP synthase (glutamine-hydrolysing)